MRLRIEKAVYGGAGLARIPAGRPTEPDSDPGLGGKTVFVPYSLPGELVNAHLTSDRRGFSNAELDSVVEPSPERVRPACEYFPACGGCQYQHAAPGYQLRMKLDILADTLRRAHLDLHLAALESSGSIGSIGCIDGPPWGYRNRVRLQAISREAMPQGAGKSGSGFSLCYRERGTHSSLAITHCPIAAPLIERAIAATLRMGKETGLVRLCDEMEFFSNGEESELLVSLLAGHSGPAHARLSAADNEARQKALDALSEGLKAQVPELVGVGVFSAQDRVPKLMSLWGRGSLHYSVAGRQYQVSLGSFFQVNRFLLPDFLQLVAGNRAGRRAWDLYAGVGLFTLGLHFERVIAVEAAIPSAADLRQNLSGTGHRAVESTALDFLRGQARKASRESPGLIVLDPPRAGLGQEACAHLVKIAAPEIVYVSCDPATLARDLQVLLQSRYRLQSLHLVDLFPQTFHLETVAVLSRK